MHMKPNGGPMKWIARTDGQESARPERYRISRFERPETVGERLCWKRGGNMRLVMTVLVLVCVARAQPPAETVALTHATVIDGTGAAPMADSLVLVRGGRIVSESPPRASHGKVIRILHRLRKVRDQRQRRCQVSRTPYSPVPS